MNAKKDAGVIKQLTVSKTFRDAVKENEKMARGAFNIAKKMVLSGKSTGDLFRDYIIVIAGKDSKELVKTLRATEALISGKTGEIILFTYEWMEDTIKYSYIIDPGMFGNNNKITLKKLFLGVLMSDKLIVTPPKGLCDFPTEKLIEGGDTGWWPERFLSKLTPGGAAIRDRLVRGESGGFFMRGQPWEVVVGPEAVVKWMKENPKWRRSVVDMASKLGKSEDLGISPA